MGVVTLIAFLSGYGYAAYRGGVLPSIFDYALFWRPVGEAAGRNFLVLSFVGLWLGAASHTFTDMAGSFVKTGRIAKFL